MPRRTPLSLLWLLLIPTPGPAQAGPEPAGDATRTAAGGLTLSSTPEAPAPEPGFPGWVEREAYLMGTRFRIRVGAGERARAVEASEGAIRAVERLEDVLSSWRENTELARANRAPVDEPVEISSELGELLTEAFRWSELTGGAFEPRVGALVDAWDLRGAGRRPDPESLERALEASGPRGLRLEDGGRTLLRRDSAAWLDAGAFGKGAALRRAKRALLDAGVEHALLDFGGQLLALGSPPGERGGWSVEVADPSSRDRAVARLELRDVSVATTGTSERFVELDGERLGHVLDPGSGRPVRSWGSVTVVAPDPAAADALSTGLFVMGPEEALRWAGGRSDVGVLVVEDRAGGPEVRWNRAMEAWLTDDS